MDSMPGYSTIQLMDRDELADTIDDDLEQYDPAHDDGIREFLVYGQELEPDYSKEELQKFIDRTFELYDEILEEETSRGLVKDYRSRVLDEESWWDQKKSIDIPSTVRAAVPTLLFGSIGMSLGGAPLGFIAGGIIGFYVENYFQQYYEERSFPLNSDADTPLTITDEVAIDYTDRYPDNDVEPRAFAGVRKALQLEMLERQAEESNNPYWEQLYTKEQLKTDLQALATAVQEKADVREVLKGIGMESETADSLAFNLEPDIDTRIASTLLSHRDEHEGSIYRELVKPPLHLHIDTDDRERLFYQSTSSA